MSPPFSIRRFHRDDQLAVERLVLTIQRDEFGLALSAENQPDLHDVAAFFSHPSSAFWVAESGQSQNIIGCIGLEALAGNVAAMRKFMVHPDWRGKATGVAASLNATFEVHAQKKQNDPDRPVDSRRHKSGPALLPEHRLHQRPD